MILRNIKEVSDTEGETVYENYKESTIIITIDNLKTTLNTTDQLESDLICLSLSRHSKFWSLHMKIPRLSNDHTNNIYVSSIKGIGGNWCAQLFYKKQKL